MKRLRLVLTILLTSLSHQAMAAQNPIKTKISPMKKDSEACITAHNECLKKYKAATEKEGHLAQECIDICEEAKMACKATPAKATTEKGIPETRFDIVKFKSLHCKNIKKAKEEQK